MILIDDYKIYTFKNNQFAAPQVGELRFAKPSPLIKFDGIKNEKICQPCTQVMGALGNFANNILPGLLVLLLEAWGVVSIVFKYPNAAIDSEDCLYLDDYVPASVLKGDTIKIPVLNCVYGGAYLVVKGWLL
jgi:carboxylesterase type B